MIKVKRSPNRLSVRRFQADIPFRCAEEPDSEQDIKPVILASAGQLVYGNDLLMTEIYSRLDYKRDLVSCMAATKAGMWLAAAELYRHIEWDTIAKLLKRGCTFDRLARISLLVRILNCPTANMPTAPDGKLDLSTASPFQQFPNLHELRIGTPRLHLMTATEQHYMAGRSLTVQRNFRAPWEAAFENLHIALTGVKNSTGPVTLLSISCRNLPEVPKPMRSTLLVPTEPAPHLLARLHDLRDLNLATYDQPLNVDLLPHLRKNCPNLVKLAVNSASWDGNRLPLALRSPGKLREIALEGPLHWLYDLRYYEAVTLTCREFGREEEMIDHLKLLQYQDTKVQSLEVRFVLNHFDWVATAQAVFAFAAKYIATLTKSCARLRFMAPKTMSTAPMSLEFLDVNGLTDRNRQDVEMLKRFGRAIALFKEETDKIDDHYRKRGHEPVGYSRVAQ